MPLKNSGADSDTMIVIESSLGKNEYDIHSLTKAFYPSEDVKIVEIERQDDPCLIYHMDNESPVFKVPENDRDELKRLIYRELSKRTGKNLPWGALTGIRPVKMAMERLMRGMKDDAVIADMKEKYYISDKKARLCVDIANRERSIVFGLYPDGYSLYIDIPFCPTTCLYCSFTSNRIGKDRTVVKDYLKALFKEIEGAGRLFVDRRLETVYIGGGTPTTLTSDELNELLGCISANFDTVNIKEYSLEAGRPDTISRDRLRVMKRYGITRISVNPQTMNENTLKVIGRLHSPADVRRAFFMARDEGFDNINMDMILGLPTETVNEVRITMDELYKLQPDNLTVHSLALKRASAMGDWIEKNGTGIAGDTGEMMDEAVKGALKMDMKPYYLYRQKNMSGNLENTGFARDMKYGVYNILINEEVQDILALGAGAISKRVYANGDCKRSANFKLVDQYIAGIDKMIERKRELFLRSEVPEA